MILATTSTPAAPEPVTTRPTINISNETEVDVMIVPMHIMIVEENKQMRELKTWDSRPIKGAREDMAMR